MAPPPLRVVMSVSDDGSDTSKSHHDRYAIAADTTDSGDSYTTSSSFTSHSGGDSFSFVSDGDLDQSVEFVESFTSDVNFESTESFVPRAQGNWFDSACGWLDRPQMCAVVVDGYGGGNSLLKESKAKNATAAIRNVKMHDALIQASRARVAIKPAAFKQPIERPSTPEELKSVRLQRKGLIEVARIKKEDRAAENDVRKDNTEEELGAQYFSVEESQIAPSNEAVNEKKNSEGYSPNQYKNELKVSKKKRIESFKNLQNIKSEETLMNGVSTGSPAKHMPQKPANAENQEESSRASLEQMVLGLKSKQKRSPTDDVEARSEAAKLEDTLEGILSAEDSEDDDILSIRNSWQSQEDNENLTAQQGAITNLTHDDDTAPMKNLPSMPSMKVKDESSPAEDAPVDGKNKEIEVIDVFEFDDQDSWFPGEENRVVSPKLRPITYGLPGLPRDPSPTKSTHASRLVRDPTPSRAVFPREKVDEIAREVISSWEKEEEKLNAKPPKPKTQKKNKSARSEIFDNLQAREEFAGLRRGLLGDTRSRSRSKSDNEQDPTPEDSSTASGTREVRSKSDDFVSHTTLQKTESESQDSKHHDIPPSQSQEKTIDVTNLEHRQQAIESRMPSVEELVENESRLTKKKDLIAVRSIDEGQRMRTPQKNRDSKRKNDTYHAHTYRERESAEKIQYGIIPSKRSETRQPIDMQNERSRVSVVREMRDSDIEQTRSRGLLIRNGSHDRGSRPMTRPDIVDVTDISEEYGLRKPKEGNSTHRSKSRDDRDGTRHSRHSKHHAAREDPVGYTPSDDDDYEDKSRRREKRSSRRDRDHDMDTWDERSVFSSKELKKLEKQLAQKLLQDEKRATKLKRLRKKKESHTLNPGEVDTTPQKTAPQAQVRLRAETLRDKSKFDQLKVLRSSKELSKYMKSSRTREASPLRLEVF